MYKEEEVMTANEAVSKFVNNGEMLAIANFLHFIPYSQGLYQLLHQTIYKKAFRCALFFTVLSSYYTKM